MNEKRITAADLHAAPYAQARQLYRSIGWQLCGRPVESEEGQRAPRIDLKASGMLAVSVPAAELYGHAPRSGALEALGELANVPAYTTRGSELVTLLYTVESLPDGSPRQLVLDGSLGAGTECFRGAPSQTNPPLPCQGPECSWLTFVAPPAAPQWLTDLCGQLATDTRATDQCVVDWIRDMFEASGPVGPHGQVVHEKRDPIVGLSREEVHHLLCKASGWGSEDFSVERLSHCADYAGLTKHRTKSGYLWLIRRRPDVPLRAPRGVDVETIDGTLLELARSLHLVRENHPQRVRARKQEQEFAEHRAQVAADVRRRFGSQEVADLLRRRQQVAGVGGGTLDGVMYSEAHVALEYKRKLACEATATEYVPLPFSESTPQWYQGADLATVSWPDLYRHVVQNFAKKAVAA